MLLSEKKTLKIWPLMLCGAVARGALTFFLTNQVSLVFGPLNLANLWKAVNRIRFIMGKFGRTQIRTSTSFSSDKKYIIFEGILNILSRGLNDLLTKLSKTILDPFMDPPGHKRAKGQKCKKGKSAKRTKEQKSKRTKGQKGKKGKKGTSTN